MPKIYEPFVDIASESQFESFESSVAPNPFDRYLEQLQATLDSDLFSDENAPDLLGYLEIPDEIDNQNKFDELFEDLNDGIKEWLTDTRFKLF